MVLEYILFYKEFLNVVLNSIFFYSFNMFAPTSTGEIDLWFSILVQSWSG